MTVVIDSKAGKAELARPTIDAAAAPRRLLRADVLVLLVDASVWWLVLGAMLSIDHGGPAVEVFVDAAALAPLVTILYHGVLRATQLTSGASDRQSMDWFLAAAITMFLVVAIDAVWNVTAAPAPQLLGAAALAGAVGALRALARYFDHGLRTIHQTSGGAGVSLPRRDGLVYAALKRVLDVAIAGAGGVVLLPMMAAIALAVRATSPGPVLFRQQRIGQGGRRFTIYKFRSMRDGGAAALLSSESARKRYEENDFKLPDDLVANVVTPLGRIIRKTSLDELPQLWNVLRGDMSLVGPRPIVDDELANYGDASGAYLGAKPGLTGAWQVSGRSDVGYPERVDFDVFYWVNRSFALDLYLTLKTIPALLLSRGAR